MPAHEALNEVLTSGATETVRDLSEYASDGSWIVVGGAAVYFWAGEQKKTGELDVAAKRLADLPPPAGTKFAFAHRQLPDENGEFYAALLGRAKVDVYRQEKGEPAPIMVPLGVSGIEVPVRGPNMQMVVSLKWLMEHVEDETRGFGLCEKAAARVKALREVVNWEEVEALWRAHGFIDRGLARNAMHRALADAIVLRSARTSLMQHNLRMLKSCKHPLCDHNNKEYLTLSPLRAVATVLRQRLVARIIG